MPFDVDLVIISNIEKRPVDGIECLVGLPTRNPWSLPFAHKKLFADRLNDYDLFIYSEDDILITERNIAAFLRVTPALREDELAGFFLVEFGPNGEKNYPQVHGQFCWDCGSAVKRGEYILAQFTNEHSACYMLTRPQLAKALASGGFLVEPHEGKYDLLCSAATDPYTQCGFKKLIPISAMEEFSAHHLPNKYVNRLGASGSELDVQISELLRIAHAKDKPRQLFNPETRLWHGMYSKDLYEPIVRELDAIVPRGANVLSVGVGSGANERRLAQAGHRVVIVPIDPVVARLPAQHGIEVLEGDVTSVRAAIASETFDCLLYLNVLQFVRDPTDFLSLFVDRLADDGLVVMSTPNMPYLRYLWRAREAVRIGYRWTSFDESGIHVTSNARLRTWCTKSGLKIEKVMKVSREDRFAKSYRWIPAPAQDIIAIARRS
jgi:2-polyprenyl-3-methyl-5-hydroxy-6-metoxy-1,4-benzoquinol methylase